MINFILSGGPLAIVQVIFTILLMAFITNIVFQIIMKKNNSFEKQFKNIKQIAIFILVLGFLGQFQGLYNAFGTIATAVSISPKIILQGLIISCNTSLYGLWVFCITYFLVIVLQLIPKTQQS